MIDAAGDWVNETRSAEAVVVAEKYDVPLT
jgi:hypothetical protein